LSNLKTYQKPVEIQATAPNISSDGGLVLLKSINSRQKLTHRFSKAITDKRSSCKHTVEKMLSQRVYGILMGWEDCNDFGELASDPLYKLVLGSVPASQPTLSRLENAVCLADVERMSKVLVDVFIDRHLARPPKRVVLDIDATDDPTHGQQEFDFYSNQYGCHCYVPLLVYGSCDGSPMEILASDLRPGSGHPVKDAPALIRRIAEQIQEALPRTEIVVRADAGFFAPEMLQTCEDLGLKYLVGAQANAVLEREASDLMVKARAVRDQTDKAARMFGSFSYKANSWQHERRVIVKAEALPARECARDPKAKDNTRFVVTNLGGDPEALYLLYCGRGECENKIKEMKLDLSSGRTSCHSFSANAFRLLLHAIAFVLMEFVRDHLSGHELARSTIGQIRLKLLKVAAIVEEATRRILVRLPRGHPHVPLLMKLVTN